MRRFSPADESLLRVQLFGQQGYENSGKFLYHALGQVEAAQTYKGGWLLGKTSPHLVRRIAADDDDGLLTQVLVRVAHGLRTTGQKSKLLLVTRSSAGCRIRGPSKRRPSCATTRNGFVLGRKDSWSTS